MSVHQFLRWMMLQKKFLMSLMAGSEMGEDGNQSECRARVKVRCQNEDVIGVYGRVQSPK